MNLKKTIRGQITMLWKEIPDLLGKYELSETGMVRNKRTRIIIKLNLNKRDDGTYKAVYFLRSKNGSRVFHLKNLFLSVYNKNIEINEKFLLNLSSEINKEKKKTTQSKYNYPKNESNLNTNVLSCEEEYEKLIENDFEYRNIEPFLEMERPETDPFAFYSFSKHE
jgi:hypothetical protein